MNQLDQNRIDTGSDLSVSEFVDEVLALQQTYMDEFDSGPNTPMSDSERAYWVPRIEQLLALPVFDGPEEIREVIDAMIYVELVMAGRLAKGEAVMVVNGEDGERFIVAQPKAASAQDGSAAEAGD